MEESEPQTQIQINEWKLAGCLFKDFFLLERAWLQKLKKKSKTKKFNHYSKFLPKESKWLYHTNDSSVDN